MNYESYYAEYEQTMASVTNNINFGIRGVIVENLKILRKRIEDDTIGVVVDMLSAEEFASCEELIAEISAQIEILDGLDLVEEYLDPTDPKNHKNSYD